MIDLSIPLKHRYPIILGWSDEEESIWRAALREPDKESNASDHRADAQGESK